jgi:ABC-type sugar transport system substrate-binding protein
VKHRALWPAAIAVLALFAAGCGGVKGIEAQHGRVADRAEAAGKQAALDAGGKTKVPPANIMLLMMNGKSDSSKRLKTQLQQVGKKKLGWTLNPCDGKGDAKKLETCAIGAIDASQVDFVFSAGVEPKDMSRIIKKADFKDVPVINIRASVHPTPLIDRSYVPSDHEAAKILDRYMIKKLNQVPPAARKIVVLTSSTGGGSARVHQLQEDIKGTGIRVVDYTQADLKKFRTDKSRVKDLLNQHDDIKAVWLANEDAVEPAGKAVNKAFKDKEFPDRPLVLGFNADPKAAEALRDNEADAVVDAAYDSTLFIAMDQAAELLGRKRPMAKGLRPKYPLNFYDLALVTKDNAPAEKEYREPKEDFVTFFFKKWQKEFGPPPKPAG